MKKAKQKRLEAAGWRVGSAAEFLGLDTVEAAMVELRLVLSRELKERRTKRGFTQTEVAREIGSSQSRVAKMEAADGSVSLDLLIRSLLALHFETSAIIGAIGASGASARSAPRER